MKRATATILAGLALSLTSVSAQQAPPTADEVAKALGFTDAEIGRIKGGEITQKDLKEGSDKELAGVVAVFFNKPVSELVEAAMQGKMLDSVAARLKRMREQMT